MDKQKVIMHIHCEALASAMSKKEFIDSYVVNFMASIDSNRLCIRTGVIIDPCSYTEAKRAAEEAYQRYVKGVIHAE